MLKEVAQVTAKAAAQPAMDPLAVYRRIAEIVGLQSPAERDRQQRAEAEPGDNVRLEGADDGFPPPRE